MTRTTIILLSLLFVQNAAWAILGCTQMYGSHIQKYGERGTRDTVDASAVYWVRNTTTADRSLHPYQDQADCENSALSPATRIEDTGNLNSGQNEQCGSAQPLRLTALPSLTNMPLCDQAVTLDATEVTHGIMGRSVISHSVSTGSADCNRWYGADFPEDFYNTGLFSKCYPESVYAEGGLAQQLTSCNDDLFSDWINSNSSSSELFCSCEDKTQAFQQYLNSDFKFAQRNVWCSTGCDSSATANMRIGKEETDYLGVFPFESIPHLELAHQFVFDRYGDDDFFRTGNAEGVNKLPRSMLKSANQYVNAFIPIQNTADGKCGIEIRPGVIESDFNWSSGGAPRTFNNDPSRPESCKSVPEDNMESLNPLGLCMTFSAVQPTTSGDTNRMSSLRNGETAKANGEHDSATERYQEKSRCLMSDYGFYYRRVARRTECLGDVAGNFSGGFEEKIETTPRPVPTEEPGEPKPSETPEIEVGGGDGISIPEGRCTCRKDDNDPSNDRQGHILCYGWEDRTGNSFYYFINCDKASGSTGDEYLPFSSDYQKVDCDDKVNVGGELLSCCEGYHDRPELARACAARVRASNQ